MSPRNRKITLIATVDCLLNQLNISHFRVSYHQLTYLYGNKTAQCYLITVRPGGGGGLPEKLGRGVRPASQNSYPIYDQNLRYSLPYL